MTHQVACALVVYGFEDLVFGSCCKNGVEAKIVSGRFIRVW